MVVIGLQINGIVGWHSKHACRVAKTYQSSYHTNWTISNLPSLCGTGQHLSHKVSCLYTTIQLITPRHQPEKVHLNQIYNNKCLSKDRHKEPQTNRPPEGQTGSPADNLLFLEEGRATMSANPSHFPL